MCGGIKMLITESDIRAEYEKSCGLREYVLPKDSIITPAAREFLMDKKVALRSADGAGSNANTSRFYGIDGKKYDVKPEYMTHLNGRFLVPKNHIRIILRGKLDSLQSAILEVQVLACDVSNKKLSDDLQDVLAFVRGLVRAEVMDEAVARQSILGLSFDEIHYRSHHPKEFYGFPHIMVDRSMGACAVAINTLRTMARETEICAYEAFSEKGKITSHEDILVSLNRLSSLFYIMIFEHLPHDYTPQPSGI